MLVRVLAIRNSFANRKSTWFNRSMNTSPAGIALIDRVAPPLNVRPRVVVFAVHAACGLRLEQVVAFALICGPGWFWNVPLTRMSTFGNVYAANAETPVRHPLF